MFSIHIFCDCIYIITFCSYKLCIDFERSDNEKYNIVAFYPLKVSFYNAIGGMRTMKCDPIQQGTSCHLKEFESFAIANRGFNKLSNDTQFLKIEMILLEIQLLQSLFKYNSFYFFIYIAHHYLRMDLADKMYLLLYWATKRLLFFCHTQ